MQLPLKIKGFTLIEILVAMAITAVIGVGALALFNAATKTGDKIKNDGDRLNNVQRAFLFLSNDIQQIATRQVRDFYGDPLPSIKSDLQAAAPYIRLTKIGRRNPALLPRSNLEHLVYSVEDNTLIRTSYTYVDGMVETAGLKRPILNSVTSMKFDFYDGETWYDYWPLSNVASEEAFSDTPKAIKLKLELADYGEIVRLYSLAEVIND